MSSGKSKCLTHETTPVDVIVTTLCNIIRASDGKVLGSLPFEYPPSGGPSIVCNGDVVLKGAVGDDYQARLHCVSAQGRWRGQGRGQGSLAHATPGYQSVVLSPTAIIMASHEHAALDAGNGNILFRGSARSIAGYSNIMAGKVFLWAEDGSKNWGSRDAKVFGNFGTADATDPTRIKIISDKNVLGGVNKPRVPAMEKYAAELYALLFYTGNAYGWPAHFLHTDTALFPSGNRLFLRSLSHLYCIGDPTLPYDWNPASRPDKVTRILTVK